MIKREDIRIVWKEDKEEGIKVCRGDLILTAITTIRNQHLKMTAVKAVEYKENIENDVRELIIRRLYGNVEDKRIELWEMVSWVERNIGHHVPLGDLKQKLKPIVDLLKHI